MRENKTASLVEAGILSSIAIVFAIISLYLPVLGAFVSIVWPVPMILLGVRHGLKWSSLCLVAAGVLIAIVVSPWQSLLLVSAMGLVGLTLGWALHKGKTALQSIFLGSIASLLSKVIFLLISFFVMGLDPFDLSPENIARTVDKAVEMYRYFGLSDESLAEMRKMLAATFELMKVILPAGFVLGAIFDTLINFLAAKAVLKRLGTHVPDLPPFREWMVPDFVLAAFGAALIMLSFYNQLPDTLWYKIAMNAQMLTAFPLIVQGLAIFWHFSHKNGWPKFFKGLLVMFLFSTPLVPQIVLVAGMLDFIFDFRKIRPARKA